MKFRRSAVRNGIGLGGLGVLVDAVTVFALFTFPQHFLAEAVARRFLETWFQPIATVGRNLAFYGIPLLAVVGGFYLVRVEEVTLKEVVVGFAVGGVTYGIGIALVSWTGTAVSLRPTATAYAVRSSLGTVRRSSVARCSRRYVR